MEGEEPLLYTPTNKQKEKSKGDIQRQAEADRWRLQKDREIVFCSLLPVVVMVVKNLIDLDDGPTEALFAIESVIIGFTLITYYKLMQYYRKLLILKRAEWNKSMMQGQNMMKGLVLVTKQHSEGRQSYRFLRSSLFVKLLVELLVHAFIPYWGISRTSYAYKLLELAMFSRLYLLLRLMHTSSSAFLKRERINAYYADFRRMNMKVRWHLTLKMLFYDHSFVAVALLVLLVVFMSGFGIYVLERHVPMSSFSSINDCIWFSFVTFTTIGYGDLYPGTQSGRLIACLCGVFGHVIVAMFGGVITNKLAPTKNQQLISVFLENQQAGSEYRNAAAKLIQNVWRETRHLQEKLQRLSSSRPGAAATVTAVSFADGSVSAAKKLKEKFNFTNHKRNRVYAAVKLFRSRRQMLAKAQLSAADPVVDHKLDAIQDMVLQLINISNQNASSSQQIKQPLNSSSMMLQPFSGRRVSVKFPGSYSLTHSSPTTPQAPQVETKDCCTESFTSTSSVHSFKDSDEDSDCESNAATELQGFQFPAPDRPQLTKESLTKLTETPSQPPPPKKTKPRLPSLISPRENPIIIEEVGDREAVRERKPSPPPSSDSNKNNSKKSKKTREQNKKKDPSRPKPEKQSESHSSKKVKSQQSRSPTLTHPKEKGKVKEKDKKASPPTTIKEYILKIDSKNNKLPSRVEDVNPDNDNNNNNHNSRSDKKKENSSKKKKKSERSYNLKDSNLWDGSWQPPEKANDSLIAMKTINPSPDLIRAASKPIDTSMVVVPGTGPSSDSTPILPPNTFGFSYSTQIPDFSKMQLLDMAPNDFVSNTSL